MHGYGMYLYFSVGADKRFMGFSMDGKFASGALEQEEAKRAFLQEYGAQCVQSASLALREMAEKSTADGVAGLVHAFSSGDLIYADTMLSNNRISKIYQKKI